MTENTLKARQGIHGAIQRELNSLQLELVKSDNAIWLHFFSDGNVIYLRTAGIDINDSHNFVIWKCSRWNQLGSMRTSYGYIFFNVNAYYLVATRITQIYSSYLDLIGYYLFLQSILPPKLQLDFH